MSWTASGSHNAFLALDRDHKGITDGQGLFGNITQQPPCRPDQCNGFAALAVFDQPNNGGNGNGMIDPGDAVWTKLLLWFDGNHDGIAQPEELITLPEWNQQNPGMTINGFDLNLPADELHGSKRQRVPILCPNLRAGVGQDHVRRVPDCDVTIASGS